MSLGSAVGGRGWPGVAVSPNNGPIMGHRQEIELAESCWETFPCYLHRWRWSWGPSGQQSSAADGEMVVNKTDLSIVSAQHCLSLVLGAGPIHYIGAQLGTSLI